ncbi:hypothetical protein ACIBH1_34025 [Nonomuraea sp. NPDC050663]|uniref:hypothetical protein n=1 Tax=Nonomuraea sp. NPDC050663 TaxID=3364370 RepID=UPI0037B0F094
MDLHERLLIQVSARDVYDAAVLAGHPHAGLVFTGQASHDAVRMVRRHGYDGPVLADRRRYAGSARLRGTVRLSPHWIADQVEAGATEILTDSGYIGAGDGDAIRSTLEQAGQWDDVIAVLPVHARWVREDRAVLLASIAAYGGPVALVVEDGPAFEPLPLPLLSAGVAALGALACGAPWSAIGVREVLRHLYPEPHEVRGGWRRGGARSAFVPSVMEFWPVERLKKLRALTCPCSTCHGRMIAWLADAEELVVNTHNSKVLHRLHLQLLSSTHRLEWWRRRMTSNVRVT